MKEENIINLYHVTPASNLPEILKTGLQTRSGGGFKDSGEPRIYLTVSPESVLDHALKYVGDWALLKVQVKSSQLHPDPYEQGHYFLTKGLPSKYIRLVGIYR